MIKVQIKIETNLSNLKLSEEQVLHFTKHMKGSLFSFADYAKIVASLSLFLLASSWLRIILPLESNPLILGALSAAHDVTYIIYKCNAIAECMNLISIFITAIQPEKNQKTRNK